MAARTGRTAQILLVDDNPGDVRLTREALKEGVAPVHLSVVSDGAEALAFLSRKGKYADAARPDIILLDLNLPKKSGYEVLDELKHAPELMHIPVIIFSSSNAERDKERTYRLHANCYVVKPVDLDKFIEAVKSINRYWLTIAALPGVSQY